MRKRGGEISRCRFCFLIVICSLWQFSLNSRPENVANAIIMYTVNFCFVVNYIIKKSAGNIDEGKLSLFKR